MALNTRLAEFLGEQSAVKWEYGKHDCGLLLADWAACAMQIPDPAAALRGLYRSRSQYEALWGSVAVLRHARRITRDLGLKRTPDPMAGDIGVIEIMDDTRKMQVVGAIRAQRGWIIRGVPQGFTRLPDEKARVVAAWRIEER